VNWNNGRNQRITVNAAITSLTLSNPTDGAVYQLLLDYTGNYDVTWPATVRWPTNTAPTLTKTNGKTDLVVMSYDNLSSRNVYRAGIQLAYNTT
jgi:hypothetical protein